jgi:HPt (histidine-containing phosphotransfer) domain-containing protein
MSTNDFSTDIHALTAALRDHGERLVDMYLQATERDVQLLIDAAHSADLKPMATIAHRVSGASAVLGFNDLALCLQQLEEAAQANDPTKAQAHLDKFQKIFRRLKEVRHAVRNPVPL